MDVPMLGIEVSSDIEMQGNMGGILFFISVVLALVYILFICTSVNQKKCRSPMSNCSLRMIEGADVIASGARLKNRAPSMAILMWWNEAVADYANLTWNINRAYGCHHGIDVICSHRTIDSRKEHWQRVRLMQRYLGHYDYVVWCDADAAFNFRSRSLRDFIGLDALPDAFLSGDFDASWNYEMTGEEARRLSDRDKVECNINSGVVLVRNSKAGSRLLDAWENSDHPNDQTALRLVYHSYMQGARRDLGHVVKVPYGTLQRFPHERPVWSFKNATQEVHEPLVLHMAGTTIKQRVDFFTRLLHHSNTSLFYC